MRKIALFCFSNLQHVGTLSLTPDTEVKNLPSESKRKGFKFELWTTSPQGHRKVNRFKVSQQGLSRFRNILNI